MNQPRISRSGQKLTCTSAMSARPIAGAVLTESVGLGFNPNGSNETRRRSPLQKLAPPSDVLERGAAGENSVRLRNGDLHDGVRGVVGAVLAGVGNRVNAAIPLPGTLGAQPEGGVRGTKCRAPDVAGSVPVTE